MGCWNGTCALSNLPIFYGDKVIGTFFVKLSDNLAGGTLCYPNGMYELIPVMFEGEYDDYGAVEDIPEDQMKRLKKLFSREPYIIEESHRYKPSDTDIVNLVERGLVKLEDNFFLDNKDGQVGLLLFHKEIFENLIHYRFDHDLSEVMNDSGLLYMRKLSNRSFKTLEEIRFNLIWEGEGGFEDRAKETFKNQYNDPVMAVELNDFEKTIALWDFYAMTRKSITPQSGGGSQDESTEFQVKLAEETIRMAKKLNKRREEVEEENCE